MINKVLSSNIETAYFFMRKFYKLNRKVLQLNRILLEKIENLCFIQFTYYDKIYNILL